MLKFKTKIVTITILVEILFAIATLMAEFFSKSLTGLIEVQAVTENRILIITAITGALATVLTITISISLLVVEKAAERYSNWVSEIYVGSRRFKSRFFIFLACISINLVLIWFNSILSVIISSLTLLIALALVFDSIRKMPAFFDDEAVLNMMLNRISQMNAEKDIREGVTRLRKIGESTPSLGSQIIEKIKESCIEIIPEKDLGPVDYASAKDNCAAQIKELGKIYSRDEKNPIPALKGIRALLEIAENNAKEIKKGKIEDHEKYVIENNVIWAKIIWKSIDNNITERNRIEYREISLIVNGYWLVATQLFDLIDSSESEYFNFLKLLSDLIDEILDQSEHLTEAEHRSLKKRMNSHYSKLATKARKAGMTDEIFNEFWNRRD